MRAGLVYPHQLYHQHPAAQGVERLILIEDPLFFRQYRFHRQKLIYNRATLLHAAEQWRKQGFEVDHWKAGTLEHSEEVGPRLQAAGVTHVQVVDPCDDWLRQRLQRSLSAAGISLTVLADPAFLTSEAEIRSFAESRKKLFFTDFYLQQRKRLDVLIEGGKPVGGKWSFDPENRKRLPKDLVPPAPGWQTTDEWTKTAQEEVRREFPDAPGAAEPCGYPVTRRAALAWLDRFLKERLSQFGDYEDAISQDEDVVFHSVLTPMLNVGLITPGEVVERALACATVVPLNSLEGFVRQVIGWREYMRLVYLTRGRQQRTCNFWGFTRPLPASFYDATTGIEPVDHVIRGVLKRAYCHHIERLMILGNFMLLCEIRPDDVYRWFMELFIDAYDWVMVPNVYGMSQHADGGMITTKPYLSGSSYVLKMSNFKRGPWCPIWDALYWRFIDRHRDFFKANPRMSVMTGQLDRMGSKLAEHHRIAESFLTNLR